MKNNFLQFMCEFYLVPIFKLDVIVFLFFYFHSLMKESAHSALNVNFLQPTYSYQSLLSTHDVDRKITFHICIQIFKKKGNKKF